MIYLYLKQALLFLLKLAIPPRPVEPEPAVDINARCPACGHRNGEIELVWETPIITEAMVGKAEMKVKLGNSYLQHKCHVCKARWYTAMLEADAQGKVVANGS